MPRLRLTQIGYSCVKMNKTNTKKWQLRLLIITAGFLLAAYLASSPATAQVLADPKATETNEKSWQAPDLAALPADWWSAFTGVSAEITSQRVSEFLDSLGQRTKGLDGDELITAQNGLAYIVASLNYWHWPGRGRLTSTMTHRWQKRPIS